MEFQAQKKFNALSQILKIKQHQTTTNKKTGLGTSYTYSLC